MSQHNDTYYDTHCHYSQIASLNFRSSTPPKIKTLSVSTSITDWRSQLAIKSSSISIALGIHPWWVIKSKSSDLETLEKCIADHNVAAIGEIGLDYEEEYKAHKPVQCVFFEQQLQLAKEYDLPVSIHARKSLDDIYHYVTKYESKGFMHGFSSSYQQAQRFTELGFKIGIGLMALNPNAKKLHQVIANIPLSSLVLESDLTEKDVKNGGRTQDEIVNVAQCIADIKKQPVDQVIEITFNNAREIIER